ncbi:MAG: CxxH/CxxC protein [Bacillota bacterium]|nr:CxxH/CxxC protein [Bacillota bacterium]MDW7685240.1 CxxH/CxxC protein [Bacillota bacterium]
MYVVCDAHIDQAIEEFVDIYESPPDLHRLDKVSFTDWTAPNYCDFCSRPPVYLVT